MSSSEQDRVREMAERVARRLASDAPRAGSGGELDALRSGLDDMQGRLARVESRLARGEGEGGAAGANQSKAPSAYAQTPTRSMWLSGTYVPATSHPSEERFNDVGEAVSELVDFFEGEKTCAVEPGAKPCDHCGMCSSRGF